MHRSRFVGLLILLLSANLMAQGRSEAILEEFGRFIKDKDPKVRRDQIERLGLVQTPKAVGLLIDKGLLDKDPEVQTTAESTLAKMRSDECQKAVFEGLSHRNARVREGVLSAIGQMRPSAPPIDRMVPLLEDRKPAVRIAAAEALGQTGMAAAGEAIVPLLQDREEEVVIAAADALALLKYKAGAPALIALLKARSWRIQVSALYALGRLRTLESVEPLIEYLGEVDGRCAEDCKRALMKITLRDFGTRVDLWKKWWTSVKGRWTIPDPKKEKVSAPAREGYDTREPHRYHRLKITSKRLLFVIDISTSMREKIVLKEGRKVKGASFQTTVAKIAIAREELARVLRGLDKNTHFNIMAFETDIRSWKKAAVPATPGAVQSAIRWVMKQRLYQPPTRGMSSGLDSKGRMKGRTNTYGALRKVFGLPVEGFGRTSGGSRKKKPLWDTVYFLSDGQPTEGTITKIPRILDEVRVWYRSSKIQINTIGLASGQGLRMLLDGLAQITGGQSVFVGK